MAKTLSFNRTDTGVEGVSTLTLDKGIINWGADFRVKSQDATSITLTNMTSPIDKPEVFKISVQPVKDVYKGSLVDPGMYGPYRKGTSLLGRLDGVFTVEDSVLGTSYDEAIEAHIVIKTSNNPLITPAIVEDFVGRALAAFYESGSASTSRIAAILRGSLKPTDL